MGAQSGDCCTVGPRIGALETGIETLRCAHLSCLSSGELQGDRRVVVWR